VLKISSQKLSLESRSSAAAKPELDSTMTC